MSDEPTYDWSTAPAEMRAEFQRIQGENKTLAEREAKAAARLAQLDRSLKFDDLKAAGGDALKDVSLEDIGDLGAEQITPTILQAKALEKAQTQQAALASLAKDAGFESVEAMQAFRTAAAEHQSQTMTAMGHTAAAATAGQGIPDPIASPSQAAFTAFTEAKTQGLPSDDAKAAAITALFQSTAAQAAK
jgi:hypothetical protein